ncbi:MAG: molybdopterin-binding protein, partial [Gordonibacter sp.]
DDIASVMGATNQLWVAGLPAKYFIRDIVNIRFTQEREVPIIEPFENDGHDFTNRPNVSVRADYVGHVGEPLTFEGYADDYDRAIAAVQFSLDEGENWTTYSLENAPMGRWVYWHFDYVPRKPGRYKMKVRAVNEYGTVSPSSATHIFEVSD